MTAARAPRGGAAPERLLRGCYSLLLCVGALLASPWLLLRMATRERYRRGLRQRLTLDLPPEAAPPRVWVHAASAGEMAAAAPIVQELERRRPGLEVVVSSATTSGIDVAARLLPERVRFLLPVDLGFAVRRVLDRVDPRALVLVELELWPNLIAQARKAGVPVVVANGRVSARTAARLRRPWLQRFVGLAAVDAFAVQTDEIAARLRDLGVAPERVTVTGNTKVDQDRSRAPSRAAVRRALGLADDAFLVVAGSTHPGEETRVGGAFLALKAEDPGARLLIAPRHKERLADAERDLAALGLAPVRLTEVRRGGSAVAEVTVVDTMGELVDLYAAADAAFVGGSLVAGVGGHNVFEPVLAGTPTLIGPHHRNVRADVVFLRDAGAIRVLDDPASLAAALLEIHAGSGARLSTAARSAVAFARGAAGRTVDVVLQRCLVVAPSESPRHLQPGA